MPTNLVLPLRRRPLVVTALIAVATLAASSCAAIPPRGLDAEVYPEIVKDAAEGNLPKGETDWIVNADFELGSGVGDPPGWCCNPISRHEIEVLEDGGTNRFLRQFAQSYFTQRFSPPVDPWESYTVLMDVRGETGMESPRLYTIALGPANEALVYATITRPVRATPRWTRFAAARTRLPGEASLQIGPTTNGLGWVDVDNLRILRESPADGSFEEIRSGIPEEAGWLLAGGADISAEGAISGARSLVLPPGASASRLVAHSPALAKYFVTGIATGPVTVEEQALDSALRLVGEPTRTTAMPDGNGRFLLQKPIVNDVELARVILSNEGPEPVVVDDVSRGWTALWPTIIEPVAGSVRPTARLSAGWRGELESLRFVVRDEDGNERVILDNPQRSGSSAWLDFDGAGLPAGVYTIDYVLENGTGQQVIQSHELRIIREGVYPPRLMSYRRPEFTRQAWLWVLPLSGIDVPETVEEMAARVQQAKDDGFNHVLFSARANQFATIRAACEQVGMSYWLYEPVLASRLDTAIRGHRTWTPEVYLEGMSIFDPLVDDPRFDGIYMVDEPNTFNVRAARTFDVMRVLDRQSKYPPVTTYLNPYFQVRGYDFGMIGTFDYPYERRFDSPIKQLLDATLGQEDDRAWADEQGRDYWMGVQGHSDYGKHNVARYEEMMAQLGMVVALGARGYFVFPYSSFEEFGSLRTHTLEAAPKLRAFQDFNARLEPLGDLLLELEQQRAVPRQINVFARTARHRFTRAQYLALVNYDPDSLSEVEVQLTAPSTLVNVETGLAYGTGTLVSVSLAPGNWALLRIDGGGEVVEASAVLEPIEQPRPAPVVVESMVPLNRAALDFALSPNGRLLAVANDGGLQVFRISGGNPVQVFQRLQSGVSGRVKWLDNDRIAYGTGWEGLRILQRQPDDSFTVANEFVRRTGGAGLVLETDPWWVTQVYYGLARVDFSRTGWEDRVEQWPVFERLFIDIYGPFLDDSVIAIDNVAGIVQVAESGEMRNQTPQSTWGRGALSSTSRLALPELDRGVRVYTLGAYGNIVRETRIIDPRLTQAQSVAWLTPELLAVVDLRFGLRFYRIDSEGAWSRAGEWPVREPATYLDKVEALGDGKLALSFDGRLGNGTLASRILLLDASGVIYANETIGWMLR